MEKEGFTLLMREEIKSNYRERTLDWTLYTWASSVQSAGVTLLSTDYQNISERDWTDAVNPYFVWLAYSWLSDRQRKD